MKTKIDLIRKEIPNKIIGALADAFGNSPQTIARWFLYSNDKLTSKKALEVYRGENFKYDSEGLKKKLSAFTR